MKAVKEKPKKGGIGSESLPERTTAAVPRRKVQDVLNELAYKNGSNYHQWPSFGEILAEHGLSREDATPEALKAADEWARKTVMEETASGRRVARPKTVPLYSVKEGATVCSPPPSTTKAVLLALNETEAKVKILKPGGGSETAYWSTHSMVVPVEEPAPIDRTTQEQEKDMSSENVIIFIDEARGLGEALGVSNAAGWSLKRATTRLNNMQELLDGAQEPEDKGAKSLLGKLVAAVKEGKTIVVTEGEHKGNCKAKIGKKGSPNKKAESKRVKYLGKYSVGSLCRWLGRKGVGLEGAKAILDGEKVGGALSDPSIGWELKERRENKPAAQLEKDEADHLKKKYAKHFEKK